MIYEGPKPPWVESISYRTAGKNWAITVYGAVDPRSRKDGERKVFYVPNRRITYSQAVETVLRRAAIMKDMRIMWQGTKLLHDAREKLPVLIAKMASPHFTSDKLYTCEATQRRLQALIEKTVEMQAEAVPETIA